MRTYSATMKYVVIEWSGRSSNVCTKGWPLLTGDVYNDN